MFGSFKPIDIDEYFSPGFKVKNLVHAGSQTLSAWFGKPEEQAFETFHLVAAVRDGDVGIARNVDPDYIAYQKTLTGGGEIINITGLSKSDYLSDALLLSTDYIEKIKANLNENSFLMPFIITESEEELARKLGISLYGSVEVAQSYGTKAGVRQLAKEAGIPMAPGIICETYKEIEEAARELSQKFSEIVVKHTLSASGYLSKRFTLDGEIDWKKEIDSMLGGPLKEGRDVLVVEGWVQSLASLCAHIEIPPNSDPVICAGWQQVIDKDGISYMGAGPLRLSPKAMHSFLAQVQKLAWTLKDRGVFGCFGPDFLVVGSEEKNLEPDTCILVEMNARVPVTALPLEMIKAVKGKIGAGFYSSHIKLNKTAKFSEVLTALKDQGLLITQKDENAKGAIPFNPGMLLYKTFDCVVMADDWEETQKIMEKVKSLFEK